MADKGKSSKQGRNKKSGQNARYINERRSEKSHYKRVKKHMKNHPNDEQNKKAMESLYIRVG